MAATMLAMLPLSEQFGVRLLKNVFRRNRLPVAGFVVAQVIGRSGRGKATLTERFTFAEGQDYHINGVVPATVARMISEGKGIRPGVHYLSAAVDPITFVAELEKSGIRLSRDWQGAQRSPQDSRGS
jgi:hypothetical protein